MLQEKMHHEFWVCVCWGGHVNSLIDLSHPTLLDFVHLKYCTVCMEGDNKKVGMHPLDTGFGYHYWRIQQGSDISLGVAKSFGDIWFYSVKLKTIIFFNLYSKQRLVKLKNKHRYHHLVSAETKSPAVCRYRTEKVIRWWSPLWIQWPSILQSLLRGSFDSEPIIV